MPTLTWIGKEAVVGHHKQVPLHLLVEDPACGAGDPGADNLLIEGDNLPAPKALLPRYAGQVKGMVYSAVKGRRLLTDQERN